MLRGEVRTAPWLGAEDTLELSSVWQKGVNQRPPCHTGVAGSHSVLYMVGLLVGWFENTCNLTRKLLWSLRLHTRLLFGWLKCSCMRSGSGFSLLPLQSLSKS